MHNRLRFSPVRLGVALVAMLAICYVGLIATVMSYAAVTIDFAQSERTDEAAVSALEADYLNAVASVTGSDYAALGYAKPETEIFVPSAPATALR
ncbi:MAG TPA: hypothetical protein VMT80_01960 [Candidatus Paceibacterota bacterium]|nr:hypothetical protein [Candidatus Paceibacterota bacterium]